MDNNSVSSINMAKNVFQVLLLSENDKIRSNNKDSAISKLIDTLRTTLWEDSAKKSTLPEM